MKNIYLDIDGVILLDDLKNAGKGALSLSLFLYHLEYNQQKGNHKVCWLTTHCRNGSTERVLEYLKSRLGSYNYDVIVRMKIKPTVWNKLKTEAIDFSQDFIWFDDDVLPEEIEELKKHDAEYKLINMDLQKDRYQLKELAYSGILGDDPWKSGDPRYLTETIENKIPCFAPILEEIKEQMSYKYKIKNFLKKVFIKINRQ